VIADQYPGQPRRDALQRRIREHPTLPGRRTAPEIWARSWNDSDGAGGVVEYGLADGAEEEAGESAAASGADNDELCLAAGLDQCLAGAAPGEGGFDGDVGVHVAPAGATILRGAGHVADAARRTP
jgi:hypothetical protein